MGSANASRSRHVRRPLGVTLLAFWEILSGIQLLVTGLVLWSVSSDAARGSVSSLLFIIGTAFIVLAISYLFWARGYFRGYESARHRGRVCAVSVIVLAIFAMVLLGEAVRVLFDSPIWTIISNVVIALYLGRPKVKAFFASGTRG